MISSLGDEIRFTYGVQMRIFSAIYDDSVDFDLFGPQGMFLVICMNRVILLKEQEKVERDYYRQFSPEISWLHGNSEFYFYNGAGGELNSALVAIGIREGEAEEKGTNEVKDVFKRAVQKKLVQNGNIVPLEYRVMYFLQAVTKDLENMTERANAANEAKSAFLSGMSHEIRTPICELSSSVVP